MISQHPKFIFIHVPKSAGSSIESALADFSIDPIDFEENGNAILPNKHISASEMISALGWEEWSSNYSFAVARNPWDRVVSNFYYLKDIGHERTGGCETVHEWIMQNKVWCLPISHYVVHEGKVVVSEIIRYDSLESEFEKVCKSLGIRVPALPCLNRSQRSHYKEYFDRDSQKAVANLFREDIERFSFEF